VIELWKADLERPSVEFQRLSWVIKPTTEDISQYYFGILRSNSPEGSFSIIAERIQDRFHYEDFDINQKSENRVFYYKIRITSPDSSAYRDYGPYHLSVTPDAIALEMIRKKNVALNFGSTAGVDIQVFIRKTWGTYCPACFDPIKKRKSLSNCSVCWGTNYIGGFFDPIASRAFFNVSQKQIQNIGFEIQSHQQLIETANYPLISPGDIIKHEETRNYRVHNVRASRRKTYVISQFVQLGEVNENDIEYEL
jgi:hypothetical protein